MAHKYLSTEIGNLKYAYSFKKVVSGYSGDCILVRRDSDDTTQAIGFSGNDLDSASLTTFLAGANGYIVTWYDQTGTVDMTQATAADQPALVQEDGAWSAYFNGASATQQLENASALTTATNSILHCVWKADITNTNELAGFQFGSTAQQFQPWSTLGNSPYIRTTGPATYETDALWDDGKWRQHSISFYNGTMSCHEHGTKMGTSTTRTNPDMANFYIGGNNTTAADMYVTEAIWFDAVLSERDIWEVTKNNYESTIFTYANLVLHIGDSISTGIYPGNGNSWERALHTALSTDRWHNQVKAGNTLGQWNTDINRLMYFGQTRFINTNSKTAMIFLGTNDMTAGATGTVAYSRMVDMVYNLKAAGFGSIVALTCLPRTQTGVSTITFADERTVFNNLLKADSNIDLVVDLDTNSNLTDFNNTTYFESDKIHLNATGAAQLASTVATALASFNFSSQGVGNMAETFALRGDSLTARYSSAGSEPALFGANDPAAVTTDHPGINGVSSIDLAGSFLTLRPIQYIGRTNTPAGKPRSILVRVKFASFGASNGIISMGGSLVSAASSINHTSMYATTGGEITAYVANNLAQTDFGTTSGASLTNVATDAGSAVWHDIVLTWTGDTTANGLEVWVDGTRRLQDTMTRALATYSANEQLCSSQITIGAGYNISNTHLFLDEVVIWDTVIDPTSVTLTSGSGSLNGASRTAYVDVPAYDGVLAAQGGVRSINGTAFSVNG